MLTLARKKCIFNAANDELILVHGADTIVINNFGKSIIKFQELQKQISPLFLDEIQNVFLIIIQLL